MSGNITDPVNDFPPEANCREAWSVQVDVASGLGSTAGDETPIEVRVYDHQGPTTISTVTMEAPALFTGEQTLAFSTTTSEYALYSGEITNTLGASPGEYPLLVKVKDSDKDENLGEIDAWNVAPVRVVIKKGWAKSWMDTSIYDNSYVGATGVSTFGSSVYVVGFYNGQSVDFDPGPGVDICTGSGTFLSKFDNDGNFQWVKHWGAHAGWEMELKTANPSLAVDFSGNLYVSGEFSGKTDFDPGDGATWATANGDEDAYLSKFNPDGTFLWVRTWGSPEPWPGVDTETTSHGMAMSKSGNIYVVGSFISTCDFDPGDGVDNHTATGTSLDGYISMFTLDEKYLGAVTWGGDNIDYPLDVAASNSGYIYICGYFWGTTDLDPGAGVDAHSSNGERDAFLLRLSATGTFMWGGTWGGKGYDQANSVVVANDGALYVAGAFENQVDFDPGPGVKLIPPSGGGEGDSLSKFDSSNNLQWARAWLNLGGSSLGCGPLAVGNDGEIYCAASFHGDDLDPDPWSDSQISIGPLSRFAPSGELIWTIVDPNDGPPIPFDMAVNSQGDIFLSGTFQGTFDFDPGLGVDKPSYVPWNQTAGFLAKYPPDLYW